MSLLRLEGVTVAYRGIPAVQDVSLTLNAGQIVTVIGPNGAGKSTLLNAVMGVHPARGGLWFDGQSLARQDIETRVRRGLVLVPERRELFSTLPVHDNLLLGGYVHRARGRLATTAAIDAIYAAFPRLHERRAQHAGTLSGGERQMLAMGRALMAKPRLLMLDEPSLGLAPRIVAEIFRMIQARAAEGCAILLVEQNARAALAIAHHGHVLESGRVTLDSPAAALAQDARVTATYLGV